MSDPAFIFWYVVLQAIAFGALLHFGSLDQRKNKGSSTPLAPDTGNEDDQLA